jgi:hypothetical protein
VSGGGGHRAGQERPRGSRWRCVGGIQPARIERLGASRGLAVEGIERPGGWSPLRLDNPAEVPRDL